MKKSILAFAVLALSSASLLAQDKAASPATKPIIFSVGVEGSLPIGTFSDAQTFGIGGTAQGEYKVADDLGLTLNAGYINYSGKTVTGVKYPSLNVIPLLAGAKYYFGTGVFVHGQLGVGFVSQKYLGENLSSTDFMFSPGIGYNFSKNVDAELKYTGISAKDGGSANSIGLRIAYNF